MDVMGQEQQEEALFLEHIPLTQWNMEPLS